MTFRGRVEHRSRQSAVYAAPAARRLAAGPAQRCRLMADPRQRTSPFAGTLTESRPARNQSSSDVLAQLVEEGVVEPVEPPTDDHSRIRRQQVHPEPSELTGELSASRCRSRASRRCPRARRDQMSVVVRCGRAPQVDAQGSAARPAPTTRHDSAAAAGRRRR